MLSKFRKGHTQFCFLSMLCGVLFSLVSANSASAQEFNLKKGDHICIIGNTLADRMQHDGWLETYFQARFPTHNLVFRNLGFSGDTLTVRLRSKDFGTPDEWLSASGSIPKATRRNRGLNPNAPVRKNRFELVNTKADVIFAFFGYNESFGGKAGLPKFKQDLKRFINHTLSQKYNGKTAPRLVLFSPIAHEDLNDRNLPDGEENNKRLAMYTKAIAQVAKAHNVPFVDLFAPSKQLYAESESALTLNGVHLNTLGNKLIAQTIDRALFSAPKVPVTSTRLAKINKAVVDKNFFWFNRYRAVDGYSTYGDRAFLRFIGGQTNYEVVQRELEILDLMTAERDKVVWAVAQGKEAKASDNNLPDFIPVETNLPGQLEGGKHKFLTGEEAIERMKLGKNMKVQLFADEKMFPDLINPVQMAFDTKGRLWVAVWRTYPHWKPGEPMDDKLLIFEDTNGDGQADKMKVFADKLHNPTGFEFWNGGVLIAHAPDLMFLKDTDGDDKADVRKRVLSGLDSADTHHTSNSFTFDPGGALYFQEGTFHRTQVETPWGPSVLSADGGVFRYEPRSHKFEIYVNYRFANPHGHVFDRWGQDVIIDGTGAVPYHGTLFSGQTANYKQGHSRKNMPRVYNRKTRPCPGLEILSSRNFPEEMQGNLLVPNVIGFLGIMRYKLVADGASIKGIEQEPVLQSDDPNFRPADIEMGPDGAIYFTDWQNPIIGHMQHNLRDPNRDQTHGRIYRIAYTSNELVQPKKIDGQPIPKLLDLLKEHEDRTRYRARIELGEREASKVIPELQKWIRRLDRKDKDYQHHMMEALWLHQNMNVVNAPLLRRMLRSPDFHARAAATRVLCYWRDRVRSPLVMLQRQINDSHPRVRLEAVRALSFFDNERALAISLQLLTHPTDRYLQYTFNETLRTLNTRLGSNLNQRNLATGLLNLLNSGRISKDRQGVLIETICEQGGQKELGAIWKRAMSMQDSSGELRDKIFRWLTEAARVRRVTPDVETQDVLKILKLTRNDPESQTAFIGLVAAWNVRDAADSLRDIAMNETSKKAARFAAISALADLQAKTSRPTLEKLANNAKDMAVRFRASVALSQLDLDVGAMVAAKAIASASKEDNLDDVVGAFLNRTKGSETLAMALLKQKVSVNTGKRILRAMYLAGRNDPTLSAVASKIAGLEAAPRPPTAKEIDQLAAIVAKEGDAARGERIFRREDLGCLKCHAINKAGGDIGPELSALGKDSPLDYVIRSVLHPNASIKEEYITRRFLTKKSQFYQGIVVDSDSNKVIVKDATGKLITIPRADIAREAKGESLMPLGITRILTKDEVVDLLKFVSVLGKPGPYAIRDVPEVRRWNVLTKVPSSLVKGIPNREEVRGVLLQPDSTAWKEAYSYFDGALNLEEVQNMTKSGVLYLQGEVNVVLGGKIQFQVESNAPLTFWIDEEPFSKQNTAIVNLKPGRHRVTLRVEAADIKGQRLRVELTKPKDSEAAFTVVHSE
ncbi:MAG: PVC-type heme-binding CxxCH protein [Gemmataceae bacterium]